MLNYRSRNVNAHLTRGTFAFGVRYEVLHKHIMPLHYTTSILSLTDAITDRIAKAEALT